MMNIAKNVFNTVFSFGGVVAIVCSALFYVALVGIGQSQERTKACYLAGMVKVNTDAGSFCTAPSNLVEIK